MGEERYRDGGRGRSHNSDIRRQENDCSRESRRRSPSPRRYGHSHAPASPRIPHDRERGELRGEERAARKSAYGARNADRNAVSVDSVEGSSRENARGHADALPELYSIHKGKVRSIRPYGVFVNLYNYRSNGLVHLSQISNHEITKKDDTDELKVQAITSVVEEGEEVWVKVISMKYEEDGSVKIGCSLKYVSQTDGRDLDPNNVQYEQLQSRPTWQAPQKLTLDAIYDVKCSRCGGHGHLKKECYSTGDKVYELLTEDDAAEIQDPGVSKKMTDATHSSGSGRHTRTEITLQNMEREDAERTKKKRKKHSSKSTRSSHLPDTVTTVEEALAVIANIEEEKRRDKEKRKQRKKKKHKHREEKKHKEKKRHDE